MDNKDLYKTLQVDSSAESEVISAAYRRLALKYHPDTNPNPDSAQRMQEINEAYQVLSDPSKRAEYDLFRRKTLDTVDKSKTEQKESSLLYQSNFFASSPYWTERIETEKKTFIKNGYFHMAVSSRNTQSEDGTTVIENFLPFQLTNNFRVYFEAQLSEESDVGCEYGMLFCHKEIANRADFYEFGISVDEGLDENVATFHLGLFNVNNG